jgi:phosphatidylserine/phosphatidylglycerophosphate/cardiolipin synthase-like enzyme
VAPACLTADIDRRLGLSSTFDTCIYWSGEMGEAFSHAPSERAQGGVPISVIIDRAGSESRHLMYLLAIAAAMLHTKLQVIDNESVQVGSTSSDIRSIRLHYITKTVGSL